MVECMYGQVVDENYSAEVVGMYAVNTDGYGILYQIFDGDYLFLIAGYFGDEDEVYPENF